MLEATPVVVNGIMYFTGSNDVFALNAQSGEVLWHYSRPVSGGLVDDASGHINRGVAVSGTRSFTETDNAHLLCLDARSGHLIWDIPYAEWNKNYGATGAPLILKDKVLVATSGGDDGVRGFLAAFDIKQENERGACGPFQRPENPALRAGPGIPTFTAAAPPGCQEPMIRS